MSESEFVIVGDYGVERRLSGGRSERLTWDDLAEVVIVTNNQGPFGEDVLILLKGRSGAGCMVPHSCPESKDVLDRVGKLPGFDWQAVIAAMQSTENASFPCWRAPEGPRPEDIPPVPPSPTPGPHAENLPLESSGGGTSPI